VTSTRRSAALPDVPTLTELGYDVVVTNWYGVVVQRLYDEIGREMSASEVRERLQATGLEPAAQSPGQFQRLIESELKRWRQTIREARIATD